MLPTIGNVFTIVNYSFIFRADLPPDALLALLCLSRAGWQTRKARVSSAHAHMDTKVRQEKAAASTDHFLELLKGCTKHQTQPAGASRRTHQIPAHPPTRRREGFACLD